MANLNDIDLNIVIFDRDYYAMRAINSYMARDRRTRVSYKASELERLQSHLNSLSEFEKPDVILLDVDSFHSADELNSLFNDLNQRFPSVRTVCISQKIDQDMVQVAARQKSEGFLLKDETRFHIASAVIYALHHDFVVTRSVKDACRDLFDGRIFRSTILPRARQFPNLTPRIRQAIELTVVEGMSAELAADEMGISGNTIRGYIRDGYRVLEASDKKKYPTQLAQKEQAFMRYTDLDE